MGMGNPLLDISANVGQDVLDKYDVKLDSAILAEEKHQPLYKELIDGYSPQYIAGGATQNSIRVGKLRKHIELSKLFFTDRISNLLNYSSMDDEKGRPIGLHGMRRKR